MRPERWNQIERLFLQAVEMPSQDRERFLSEVCQGDETLRQELNSLLACDVPETPLVKGSFLPPTEPIDSISSTVIDGVGRRIGPYRLVRLLGRGGMGSVHLAVRDDEQYQKEVAIKLLKRGMDTDFMLHRFRQERQILASLEHPFIARLIDGGATDDGLPYFVMEYVDGLPITKYCAEQNLDLGERLRLFRLVCEAVQYAHQHLVIHRDLKPGNILITKERIPKLLDFGIAKLINSERPWEMATITGPEQRMLTPDYASPEQFRGQKISTSSDIYSLGAVLYELLTEQTAHRLDFESLAAMEKAICEEEPEKPSLAVARGSGEASRSHRQRSRQLSGDLDNIILTALRKEPQRRYPSVSELSEDIRRHLEGLPVTARDDRLTYRMGKFIRRNKLGVGAAALLLATLTGGILSTSFQARRAERRFQLVRGLANSMLFDLHDEMEKLPGSTALQALTIRTVVKYLDTLARDGSPDPDLDLEIALAYERAGGLEGHTYRANVGRGEEGLSHYRKALRIYERLVDDPKHASRATRGMIETHLNVGQMEAVLGNSKAAATHLQQASEIAGKAFALGSSDIPPSTQVNLYFRLGDAEYQQGNADGELAYYRKALEVSEKWASVDTGSEALKNLRDCYHEVGAAQARTGDLHSARDSYQKAEEAAIKLSNKADAALGQRYDTISLHNAFGDILAAPDDPNFGDRAGALRRYQAALELAQASAAADPKNLNARRTLAICYRRIGMLLAHGKPAESVGYYEKALPIAEDLYGSDPTNVEYRYALSRSYMGLGEALYALRKNDDAIQYLIRAVDLQKSIEATSPERIWNLRVFSRTCGILGSALLERGDPVRALEALREGLAVADRMLQHAPSSLYHQLDRADAMEALGAYYRTLSTRSGLSAARRDELKAEGRSWFNKSLAIWQDWTSRNLGAPYAAGRQSQAATLIALCNEPS